jgi:hypothetical protein
MGGKRGYNKRDSWESEELALQLHLTSSWTDRHDITEILLKVALSTINQPTNQKEHWNSLTFIKTGGH